MTWDTEVSDGPSNLPSIDWQEIRQKVVLALGEDRVAREFEELGIKFSKPNPTAKGWRECHAINREDNNPSAAVNLKTGYYTDRGSTDKAIHLFNFAMEYGGGRFGRWIDAARFYAEKARIPIGKVAPGKGGRITEATFDYHRPDGSIAYRVFRYRLPNGKKNFSQHPPDGRGGWKFGSGCMDGVDPLPFRLPDLIADPPDETLYIVEGEGKVNRLRGLGLRATCAHGGADNFKQTWVKFSPGWFHGRPCVVLADQDVPGRAYATMVAGWLRGAQAASVRVLDLPDLGPGLDVLNWLDQSGTPEELVRLASECPEWWPRDAGEDDVEENQQPADDGLPSDREVITVCLDDVVEQEIRWLVPNRIPLGMLTLFAGDQKVGKGFLMMDLIARITTGGEVPGGQGECLPEGSVVILTAEEGLSNIIKPRVRAAGGNLKKVHELSGILNPDGTPASFDLTYIGHIERSIIRFHDTIALVVDPVTSYLPAGIDDHKAVQLRQVFGPLVKMAERLGLAIIFVHHLTKGNGTKGLYRVSGSGAYTQVCRSNWLVCKDPKDRTRRLMLSLGTNLVEDPPGLAYRIDREEGRIVWDDQPVPMTADDALRDERDEANERRGGNENASKVEQCEAWLVERLTPGVIVSSDDLIQEGKKKGFSRDTMFEAKKRAGIRADKTGYQGKWGWIMDPVPKESEEIDPDF